MITLHPMTDQDFAWLLGDGPAPEGLTLGCYEIGYGVAPPIRAGG